MYMLKSCVTFQKPSLYLTFLESIGLENNSCSSLKLRLHEISAVRFRLDWIQSGTS